jgi:hypothetical protein
LLASCGNQAPNSVSNYYDAQKSYAQAINSVVGQPPALTVVSPPLFLWDIGRVLQGNNALGKCALPTPASQAIDPLPPSDSERTFTLGAQVPAAVTNGIVAVNVDAHYDSIVRLDYEDTSGQIVDQVDIDPVLNDISCKKVIASASGSLPITIVKGQILAKQKYTWLQNARSSVGAKINVAPGVDPVGFSVSGGGGPGAPIVLTEDTPHAHFLIVETYQSVAKVAATESTSARAGSLEKAYTAVETPTITQLAIQSGAVGGDLPKRP